MPGLAALGDLELKGGKTNMSRHMTSKAVAAAFALTAMTTVALATPLGLPKQSNTQRGGITSVAFVFDGQQTLFTAIDGFVFVVEQDAQGNLLFVDPNNNAWVPLACCAVGQVEGAQGPVTVVAGILWEQSGFYGAPLVYDGGINAPFPWTPQQ